MINTVKSDHYLDPQQITQTVHIIGCGSVGSTLADHLARYGIKHFELYDFDKVESKNVVNQMYDAQDVGKLKAEETARKLRNINDEIDIVVHNDGWQEEDETQLDGYVFLCVDSIDTRRAIVEQNYYNSSIALMMDFRTALVEGQLFTANWLNINDRKFLKDSMGFSSDEAVQVTACGVEMGVPTTVRMLVDLGVANFMSFVKNYKMNRLMTINIENMEIIKV